MQENKKNYFKVYDFTNENVACLKYIYDFDGAKVLSIVGSGDQYLASMLNGASKVELFDINPTSELYLLLKFYAIRELTFEEFINFIVKKDFSNIEIYNKLEKVLPREVLIYLKFLIINNTKKQRKKFCFRKDGITILSRKNKVYYFNKYRQIIPYLFRENYYKLKHILKKSNPPKVYKKNILDMKEQIKSNYDILLLSNIYEYLGMDMELFTDMLHDFDIPEIEACYDWFGTYCERFRKSGYEINIVSPSSPHEFSERFNYIYSLKK